jgi:hypothetical protein
MTFLTHWQETKSGANPAWFIQTPSKDVRILLVSENGVWLVFVSIGVPGAIPQRHVINQTGLTPVQARQEATRLALGTVSAEHAKWQRRLDEMLSLPEY